MLMSHTFQHTEEKEAVKIFASFFKIKVLLRRVFRHTNRCSLTKADERKTVFVALNVTFTLTNK
jgi:hypothetical protein